MAQRVDKFPETSRPGFRSLKDPLVLEAVEAELWDSAYPGDDTDRRLLAEDIIKAIENARHRRD